MPCYIRYGHLGPAPECVCLPSPPPLLLSSYRLTPPPPPQTLLSLSLWTFHFPRRALTSQRSPKLRLVGCAVELPNSELAMAHAG